MIFRIGSRLLDNKIKFDAIQNSYVYIVTNTYRTTFYIGVTSDLKQRMLDHLENRGSKFTSKYKLHDFIYFEEFTNINQAIFKRKTIEKLEKELEIEFD